MKKLILLFAVFFTFTAIGQVTNEGKPLSWKLQNITESIQANELPRFNLEQVKAEDAINDNLPAKPWRFGYMHSVDFGFDNGEWTTLENGDRIFRMLVQSNGALSLNFIFDDFYMPKGGKVYLYSDDRTDLLGAYTETQNQDSGILGTWLVKGDKVWIEYFEPAEVAGQGRLHIAKATHGYRNAQTFQEEKGLNDSGDCNLDVDCGVGDDWTALKDHNKRSVGILLQGGSGFCTGALINNTNSDGTPYFLTANHCFSDPAAWSFRFGWISPNSVCASTANSTNGPTNMTISGGTLRARDAGSDFCLVEINSDVPEAWDRVYAGWDKSDITPEFSVGIHHPSGDVMKICRDDSPLTKEVNAGAQTWEITSAGAGWEQGVTEPGSSGSPLFDNNGNIIGQLFGGGAACSGIVDNNAFDYYGRLAVSWTGGGSSANRLSDWLDPDGLNPDVMPSSPAFEVLALDGALSVNIPELNCLETSFEPTITLVNRGSGDITDAVITWSINGGSETTINYSGTLAQNANVAFDLGTQDFGLGTHTVDATLASVNNTTDENAGNNTRSSSVTVVDDGIVTETVTLTLTTDTYAEETSWEWRTSDGTILDSASYNQTSDDSTTFTETFTVNPETCYEFELFDEFGDGICCQYGAGSYQLTTQDGTVIASGGQFGSSELTEISIADELGVDDVVLNSVVLYPNPTSNVLNVALAQTSGNYNFTITNALGQRVMQGELNTSNNVISTATMASGLYFVTIQNELTNASIVKKIVKE